MPPAIALKHVRKTFGDKVAVADLDLTIEEGLLVGFIGPNGAGKTTTIRMIMSIIFPDSGEISVLGKASAIESKDRIGYLPEERGLYKKMRVGQFLTYVARLKGVDAAGLDQRVKTWLERVALQDVYRKKCEELSKGMQQKVQFIAAIIHEPDLLILDEPFSGLDPVNARLLRSLIDEQHDAGRTIIFSTHQMSQAETLCGRVVMIHHGQKVLDDTPEAIRSKFDPRAIDLEPARGNIAIAMESFPEIADSRADNGVVRIHLKDGVDAVAMVPRLAAASAARRIEIVRPSLEDIFIDIVQGGDGDADALRASLNAPYIRAGAGGD